MKKNTFKSIKKRIIATALAIVTAFSVIGFSAITSYAAAPSPKEIVKDLTEYTVEKAIDFVPGGEIVQDLLKKGSGYILAMIFDEEETKEEQPSIQDVLNQLDQMDEKISTYHNEEMKELQLINANIDSKDFRQEADSISDNYQQAIRKMNQYSKNITTPGEGMIDETTYRTYKAIVADQTCDMSMLEANFNIMTSYVIGNRSSTDYKSGYRITSEYLMQKVLAGYKEDSHDWNTTVDFKKAVETVNNELLTMQADATMDYVTIMALNDMNYKIREYEIANGIYTPTELEDPYSYYVNFARDLSKSLSAMNDCYNEVVQENNNNHDFVQATVTLSEPVNGLQTKGFHNFSEAWAEAAATGKDFTITGYQDVKADAKNGYNVYNLDKTKYCYTSGPYGYLVKSGRNITVDLTGHTFDSSATSVPQGSRMGAFGLEGNVNFNLKNATIKGGDWGIYVHKWDDVTTNLENVSINGTKDSAILYSNDNSKNMKLNMKDCNVTGTCNNSAVRLASGHCIYNIDGCTFEGNHGQNGGAINCPTVNDNDKITNCTFTNNHADNGYGGALHIGKAIISNSKFNNNESNYVIGLSRYETRANKGAGGAISSSQLIIDRCDFNSNHTNDQAGAIIVWSRGGWGVSAITNCNFTNNEALNVGGAVRVFDVGKCSDVQYIKNCQFNNNRCHDQGGRGAGVFIEESVNNYYNNVLSNWGNTGNNVREWGIYAYQQY